MAASKRSQASCSVRHPWESEHSHWHSPRGCPRDLSIARSRADGADAGAPLAGLRCAARIPI